MATIISETIRKLPPELWEKYLAKKLGNERLWVGKRYTRSFQNNLSVITDSNLCV